MTDYMCSECGLGYEDTPMASSNPHPKEECIERLRPLIVDLEQQLVRTRNGLLRALRRDK